MTLMTVGCLLLTQLSANGTFAKDMFWGMLVLGPGLGAGTVAANIAALSRVAESESGLASGISNTAYQIGAALGVAMVTTVTALHADSVRSEVAAAEALTVGYSAGFVAVSVVSALGVLAAAFLPAGKSDAHGGRTSRC